VYKSSFKTYVFKFIAPVGLLIWGCNLYINFSLEGIGFSNNSNIGFLLLFLWVAYLVISTSIQSKYIYATNDELLIKKGNQRLELLYSDIISISIIDISAPFGVTIKYKDNRSRGIKKITYFPQEGSQSVFKEDRMTAFIKGKILEYQPNRTIEHPSTVKNGFILLIVNLIVVIPIFCLISDLLPF